jgi:transcriptional regulator with XRE-family HTH domain
MLAELALARLRRGRGVTQDHLAKVLKVRQAAVSKLEGRDDLLLSTLAAYVRALGGTLEVVARFGDRAIRLDPENPQHARMAKRIEGAPR